MKYYPYTVEFMALCAATGAGLMPFERRLKLIFIGSMQRRARFAGRECGGMPKGNRLSTRLASLCRAITRASLDLDSTRSPFRRVFDS